MGSIRSTIKDYAKLARLQTSPIVMFIPLTGALAVGSRSYYDLTVLAIIALLTHIFCFTSNEYIDRDVDKLSSGLTKKPLIKKSIPPINALYIAIVCITLAFIITIIFFPRPKPVFLYSIAMAYAFFYNLSGKKVPGFEVVLGIWAFIFTIFAAEAVSGKVSDLIYLLAVLFLLQMWMACAVDGNVKDADHDFKAGVRTVATYLGVKTEGSRMVMPESFKAFCMALSAIYMAIVIVYYQIWIIPGQTWQLPVVIFLGFIMLYAQYKMVEIKTFNREKILAYIIWHQFPTVMIPIIMLVATIGILGSAALTLFVFLLAGIIIISIYGTEPPIV